MPFPDFIDNTMRKAFAVCPTKFKYEFVQNVTPAGQKSIHLQFGAAFAAGLESTREAFFTHYFSPENSVKCGKHVAMEYFEGTDSEGTYKTIDRLAGAIDYYFKTWPLDEEYIVPVKDGIECTFELPLPIQHPDSGKQLMYVGRYDMLGEHSQRPGQLWVVDEKTASRLGDMWDAKWDLDCQLTGYMWSVREQFRRGLRGDPLADHANLDVRGMVRAVSILKDGFGHTEVPMIRSAWYIDRWYGQLCRDVQRMVQSYKMGVWDLALHEHACVQFGRRCDYNPLCLTPHPQRIVEASYVPRVWNPLERGSE